MKSYYIPPASFNIFGFEIRFYGLIMALAMLIGVAVACKLCKKHNIKTDDILLLALCVLPLSVIGARLYYCFFYEHKYTIMEILNIRQGGLAIYGGVIGGVVGILLFCLIKREFNLLAKICDICVPCLILGQSIGRWGNFFNQEAYGNLVTNPSLQWFPMSVFIESKNAWFQATFFYESLWNLVGFALLLLVFYRTKKIGTTTGTYLLWYGIGRAVIEGLRADSLYIARTNIRVSQMLSVILAIIGLVILIINFIRRRKNSDQEI